MPVATVLDILEALNTAGHKGLQAGQLAGLFTHPRGDLRGRILVNQMLANLEIPGRVKRGGRKEPSLAYHNIPTWRWYITPAGKEWLQSGGLTGISEAAARSRVLHAELRSQRMRARAALITEAAERLGDLSTAAYWAKRSGPIRQARDEMVVYYRDKGLSLRELGDLCGMTGERVRQICRLYSQPGGTSGDTGA